MRFLIILSFLAACSWKSKVKNLSDAEFDHYYALKVYMDEPTQKTYLKLKTEEERNEFLKQQGLWDRFYKYNDYMRQAIVDGKVEVGWTKDAMLMSWGAPYESRKLPGRKAERSELYVYRFEQAADGSVLVWTKDSKTYYKAVNLFVREVIIDDDRVAEINQKEAHW